MTFSSLQQYIIMKCWGGQKIDRKIFADFYGHPVISTGAKRNGEIPSVKLRDSSAPRPGRVGRNDKLQTKIITKSLERLIDKGTIVGYGVRTPKKWFIKEVKITKQGKKCWQKWQGKKQRELSF